VRIFYGADLVAEHRRSNEPHASVIEQSHYDGLLRPVGSRAQPAAGGELAALGRSLADYADVFAGAAA